MSNLMKPFKEILWMEILLFMTLYLGARREG